MSDNVIPLKGAQSRVTPPARDTTPVYVTRDKVEEVLRELLTG